MKWFTQRESGIALVVCFSMAIMVWGGDVDAQSNYPNKSIRLVVPFAPGGGSDILARIVGQGLSETFQQRVVVDNRPGAGGNIGTDLVAKALPDGYTLVLGVVGPISINISLFRNLPYDPLRDLAPITQAVAVTNILVVHPSLGVKSAKALIALGKARPGTLVFASGGTGTAGHLAAELFKSMAGLQMAHVPYKGSGPAMADLLGGQVGLFFDNMPSAYPHVKAGKLVALGVTTAKRSAAAPDISTIAEAAALPGYEATNWYGFLAPAGTPRLIIDKLNAEILRILQMPEVKAKLAAQGAEVIGNSPSEFGEIIRAEIPKWQKVIKESGATAD